MSDHDQPGWPTASGDKPGDGKTVELRRPEPEQAADVSEPERRPDVADNSDTDADADGGDDTAGNATDEPESDSPEESKSDELDESEEPDESVDFDEAAGSGPSGERTRQLPRPEPASAEEDDSEEDDSDEDDEHGPGEQRTTPLPVPTAEELAGPPRDDDADGSDDDGEPASEVDRDEPDEAHGEADDGPDAEDVGESENDTADADDADAGEPVPDSQRTTRLPRPDPVSSSQAADDAEADDAEADDADGSEDADEADEAEDGEPDLAGDDAEDGALEGGDRENDQWAPVGGRTTRLSVPEPDAEPSAGPESREWPEATDDADEVDEAEAPDEGRDGVGETTVAAVFPRERDQPEKSAQPDLAQPGLAQPWPEEREPEGRLWPAAEEPADRWPDEIPADEVTADGHRGAAPATAEEPDATEWPQAAGPVETATTRRWPAEGDAPAGRTGDRADRGHATGELPRVGVESSAGAEPAVASPAERTRQFRPVGPVPPAKQPPRQPPRQPPEQRAEQTTVLPPVRPPRQDQREDQRRDQGSERDRTMVFPRVGEGRPPLAPPPGRDPAAARTQIIRMDGPPPGRPGPRPPEPLRGTPPPPDLPATGPEAEEVAADGAAPAPKGRRKLLITLAAVVLVIGVGAGVVLAVPSLRKAVGLGGKEDVAIAPPPAPVAFTPSLRAPNAQAPAPTVSGVASALAGPTGAAVLGNLGGSVVDPATGKVLWERNASIPLTPASTGKLLTAAAALLSLDHTEQFVTKVVAGSEPGTVVIVGGGDPTLSALPAGKSSVYLGAAHLDDLIAQVKANSGGQISQVLVDQSRYRGDTFASGWLRADIQAGYITPIAPAMLDGGRTTDPTNKDGTRTDNPGRMLATAFAQRVGATVPQKWETTAPRDAKVLGEVRSAPLAELVENLLLISDNVLAETVAHEVAIAAGEEPSFAGAERAMLKVLKDNGFDTAGVIMSDASGLSTEDKIPPALLSSVLAVAAAPDGADPRTAKLRPLLAGLPVAGGSGTLSNRYQGPSSSAGKGWARAKTGSLSDGGANSLGGLVLDVDGRVLVFTLISSSSNNATAVREALDTIVATLRQCGCR